MVLLAEKLSPTCPTGVVVIFVKETNPEKIPKEISAGNLLETVKLEENQRMIHCWYWVGGFGFLGSSENGRDW